MRLNGFVEKGWGSENIWASNNKYCGKMLNFNAGAKFSMHFHAEKDETWYVIMGRFVVRVIDTATAEVEERELVPGDVWHNPPLSPHQFICIEPGMICEVSTPDSVEDNYRVGKGDSQQ
jgi:mannose-6-phosphate isomerase-like protein (cupin superfamily)